MFTEPWEFIKAVIHFWADWSTGGVLVLAIALARLFKSSDFRTKTWWSFLLFFLLLGFFSAWEDQKQNRITAEQDRDSNKRLADYNQKRIDKLSDTLEVINATNKVQPSIDNSIHQSASNNSGTLVQAANSPNMTVTVKPKPYIDFTQLKSLNVPDGVNFKTEFLINIAYATDDQTIQLESPSHIEIINRSFKFTGGFISGLDMNHHYFSNGMEFSYIVITKEKIQEKDFKFSLIPTP